MAPAGNVPLSFGLDRIPVHPPAQAAAPLQRSAHPVMQMAKGDWNSHQRKARRALYVEKAGETVAAATAQGARSGDRGSNPRATLQALRDSYNGMKQWYADGRTEAEAQWERYKANYKKALAEWTQYGEVEAQVHDDAVRERIREEPGGRPQGGASA